MRMPFSMPSGQTAASQLSEQPLEGAEPQASDRLPPLRTARARATHLSGIDGLRAFAALAVLFAHTGAFSVTAGSLNSKVYNLSTFGDQGLTLFFAISGFLLFLPFVSALLADRPMPSIRRYFTNRGLRIFPAYIVTFSSCWQPGRSASTGTLSIMFGPTRDASAIRQ